MSAPQQDLGYQALDKEKERQIRDNTAAASHVVAAGQDALAEH